MGGKILRPGMNAQQVQGLMLQLNLKAAELQASHWAQRNRPCVIHPPELLQDVDKNWRAVLGEVMGVGASPDAALKDFDRVFLGVVGEEVDGE